MSCNCPCPLRLSVSFNFLRSKTPTKCLIQPFHRDIRCHSHSYLNIQIVVFRTPTFAITRYDGETAFSIYQAGSIRQSCFTKRDYQLFRAVVGVIGSLATRTESLTAKSAGELKSVASAALSGAILASYFGLECFNYQFVQFSLRTIRLMFCFIAVMADRQAFRYRPIHSFPNCAMHFTRDSVFLCHYENLRNHLNLSDQSRYDKNQFCRYENQ